MSALSAATSTWEGVVTRAGVGVVASAILASGWGYATGRIGGLIRSRRNEVRGCWYEVLAPYDNRPERLDLVKVRQRGRRVFGQIERLRPEGEKGSKWRFDGYNYGDEIVCVYYGTSPNRDPSSYGTITLNRDRRDPKGTFRGYYTRPKFVDYDELTTTGAPPHACVWHRNHPDFDTSDRAPSVESRRP